MKMSNSGNPNGAINNSSNSGTRDGTRVVLREITATLQNSPPIHLGIRKVANTTQSGKTEHEVKVQFTREFVDAGAPDSRPESLSSASSFQSLASTLSTKSGNQSSPVTPQRAANTSYINTDIPGLDDLIAACGNIQLNDKLETEETQSFQSLADNTITVTSDNNSFHVPNALQNLSQEEAFASAINDTSNLNGTHDLSSDYKEACENSINFNDTREAGLAEELGNQNSDAVKDISVKQTDENLITNHVKDSQDIPQSFVNYSTSLENRNSSLNSGIAEGLSLNETTELAPNSEQLDDNLPEVQNSSASSDSLETPQKLNQTEETVATCNSTFNNLNSSKSDTFNLTHDIANDNGNSAIDCNSQIETTEADHSSNELSATEAEGNVSSLNDPLNLPPESDACADTDTSKSNVQILSTTNGAVNESLVVDESLSKEPISLIESLVEPEIAKDFEKEKSLQTPKKLLEQCMPDSSTDHFTEVIPGFTNQTEVGASSSGVVSDISTDISAEFLKKSIAQEEAEHISDNHNVSTTATICEEKIEVEANLKETEPLQAPEIIETPETVVPVVLNSAEPELESNETKELPSEKAIDQVTEIPEKAESVEVVLPVLETIVPCVASQDLSNDLQESGESKSEELPHVVINVTPFPGYNLESNQNSTLNVEEGSQNGSSSIGEHSNETVTLKEESFHSIDSEGVSETYNSFQPEKQSTTLNSDSNFKKLELAAQGIAEEIHNKSLELTEDSEQFFNADADLFLDTASFDFFLTRNNSQNPRRDLGAESLYVKFDPLVGNVNMLPQGPPQVVDGEENAKNNIPQPTLDTPKRNPAVAAIDRLLFYSPANRTPNKVEEPPKIEEKIMADVIPEAVPVVDETMAKELELVRSTVLQLDSQLEKQRKEHEDELEKQRLKYKELEMELAREVQKKNEMTMVMDEYEKSLSRHMTDREQERTSFKQEKAKLQEELQAANHHLGNTEAAFNDVHSKYERLKSVVSAYKSNEDVLKESVQDNVETIKTLEARYEQLKSHAMTQLEKANLELEAIRKQHETEIVRLQAMIRKADLKSNSLAEIVEQKTKENTELSQILDDMIARVGHHPE